MTAISVGPVVQTIKGLSMVRVFLTANIPSIKNLGEWAEFRKQNGTTSHSTKQNSTVNLLEDRNIGLSELMDHLAVHGLVPTRAFRSHRKGDDIRLAIIFEKDQHINMLSQEKIEQLKLILADGSWAVRVDRNGPVARVSVDHAVISCTRRTRAEPLRNLIIASDATVCLG